MPRMPYGNRPARPDLFRQILAQATGRHIAAIALIGLSASGCSGVGSTSRGLIGSRFRPPASSVPRTGHADLSLARSEPRDEPPRLSAPSARTAGLPKTFGPRPDAGSGPKDSTDDDRSELAVELNAPRMPAQATGTEEITTVAHTDTASPQPEHVLPAGEAWLTVDLAINACLLADPQLRAGWEAIGQANADFVTSSLKPNPTVSVSQTLMPLTRPFTVNRQGGPPQLDVGLAAPIDWYLFGKRAAHMVVAERAVRVSESEYADLIRKRVTETALAYYDLVAAHAVLELTDQDLDNLRKVETATREAIDNGGKPAIDAQRIRVQLLAGEAIRRDSLAAFVGARAALNVLMGRPAGEPIANVPLEIPEPTALAPLSVDEAVNVARESRPDIQALRWAVSEADARICSACQDGRPNVVPRIGYTRQFQQKAIGFPDANSFGVGLDMSLPVHDRNQGNIDHAYSARRQSQWRLQAAELQLTAEIARTSELVNAAYENAMTVNREQLELSRQVRDAIQLAYEAGGRPLIEVLDAQRVYRDAYRQFIQARVNYWKARTQYQGAIGSQVMP